MKSFPAIIRTVFLLALLTGCSGDGTPVGVSEQSATSSATGVTGTESTGDGAFDSIESTGIDGKPIERTDAARLRILRPAPESVLTNSQVNVFFQADNYALSPGGNSVRYIVNNGSPMTFAARNAPATVSGLREGGQTVRAYLVTPDGTALKNREAFTMVHFYVNRKDFQNYISPNGALLTVNQPSGTYQPDAADAVVLDFLVANADMGEYKVRYILDGMTNTVTTMDPVPLPGLPAGTHKIIVELLRNDKPAAGMYNRVERAFTVVRPEVPVTQSTPSSGEVTAP